MLFEPCIFFSAPIVQLGQNIRLLSGRSQVQILLGAPIFLFSNNYTFLIRRVIIYDERNSGCEAAVSET